MVFNQRRHIPCWKIQTQAFPASLSRWVTQLSEIQPQLGHSQWNHYYVRAINGEVRLWVNGHEVSGGNGASPPEGFLCLESKVLRSNSKTSKSASFRDCVRLPTTLHFPHLPQSLPVPSIRIRAGISVWTCDSFWIANAAQSHSIASLATNKSLNRGMASANYLLSHLAHSNQTT